MHSQKAAPAPPHREQTRVAQYHSLAAGSFVKSFGGFIRDIGPPCSKGQPGVEEQRIVAARIVTKPVVIPRCSIEQRVDRVLRAQLQVRERLQPGIRLAEGVQSASMIKLLLSGLPLALPLIGTAAKSAGFALPDVFCQPKLVP